MSLSVGIVGLPNVGKSTLFNALTKQAVPAENYPFCTIDPSVGIVPVPDERLDKLAELSRSEKKIPAVVEFVDIAGLVKGAHEGEGLGNKFLANIRETDAIAHVVRLFENSDITHVDGSIDPMRDIEVINLELIMADLSTVTKRHANIERDAKRGDKEALRESEVLTRLENLFDEGKPALALEVQPEDEKYVKALHLLSRKPMFYVLNIESSVESLDVLRERYKDFFGYLEDSGSRFVVLDIAVEHELRELSEEEKSEFKKEMGVEGGFGLGALVETGYDILGLITFFTTGEKETRGWTIKVGSTAPEAGAAIHSDFRDKFIRAEVIASEKLLEAGSYARARELGWLRLEGKEYVVEDGDVIEFRI